MDKRDNYFETRIRAAQAQINQRPGSFSLSQDFAFRVGAPAAGGMRWGGRGTDTLVPNSKMGRGEDAQP